MFKITVFIFLNLAHKGFVEHYNLSTQTETTWYCDIVSQGSNFLNFREKISWLRAVKGQGLTELSARDK